MGENRVAARMVSVMADEEFNDTLETAPVMPKSRRSIDAQTVRQQREDPKFKKLRAKFRATCARTGAPCWLCNGDIDYRLTYPHPFSWSLEHKITVKERPDLLMDVENFAASHYDCNMARGTDEPTIDIGAPSELW
jgi:hypothetical protein